MNEVAKVTPADDGFGVTENRSNNSLIIGKMAKFSNDAKFVIDKTTEISSETTLVAVGVITAWVHWVDGKPAEHRITQEGQIHPDREDMPDRDESLWPPSRFTDNGEDPWKNTRYLHLVNPQTGADFTFVTDTFGGRRAVSDLKSQIRNVRAAHPGALPIIQLRSTMMPSKRFGPKPRPEFVVVGWHGQRETAAQPAQLVPPLQAIEQQKPKPPLKDDPISTGRPTPKDDMDDSIPF